MESGIIILEGQYLVTFQLHHNLRGWAWTWRGLPVATLFCRYAIYTVLFFYLQHSRLAIISLLFLYRFIHPPAARQKAVAQCSIADRINEAVCTCPYLTKYSLQVTGCHICAGLGAVAA